ncbi:MAG: hypothetical protein NTV51_13220 [Verrucomicrobia bacterium]|nr:hypothetical protein [Verrucomicrobiota bacterium]
MTALEILSAIRTAVAAIPLDDAAPAPAEPLFEAVELAANQDLPRQLQELLVMKKRACLIVPVAVRRQASDRTGALSVLGRKYAEVALLYSDQAYFKPSQSVTFGDARRLGLFAFDEKIEAALTGRELSPFGGLVFADSQPVLFTEAESARLGGRHAWFITAYVPLGLIAEPVV